ncbi:MAG: HD domain-containing protein [Thermodesulfobacteriota bacterium]
MKGTSHIPNEQDCFSLLQKYNTPDHIVAHSAKVWEVGRVLAEGLLRCNYRVDMDLIRASCLLHDIGKYPCILEGRGAHDVRGEQILQEEGYPSVARIVVQHVVLRSGREAPVGEEHVVYYSDKRVVHDELVSVEDRFIYLFATYGRMANAEKFLERMKGETLRLEQAIFALLDFRPEDLPGLLTP